MTPEEKAARLDQIKASVLSGIPICGTCGRRTAEDYSQTYLFNTRVSVQIYDGAYINKEHNSNIYYPRHICKYCYNGVQLLRIFQNRSSHHIKKAHMIQKAKIFETICYLCFKVLGKDKYPLYFGKKIYERKRDEYVLAAFLKDLCHRCNVEILPKNLEDAWLCRTCNHQLLDLRNFKKETSNLEAVMKSLKDGPKGSVARDPRIVLVKNKPAKTTEWRAPRKITFASVEEINHGGNGHLPQGVKDAVSLHRIPSHQKSSPQNNQSITLQRTRGRWANVWSKTEINDLLDSLSRHYVPGSFVRWPLVMQDMAEKGYTRTKLQNQQQWYKLKGQALASLQKPSSPILERVAHLLNVRRERTEDPLSEDSNSMNSRILQLLSENTTELAAANEENDMEEMEYQRHRAPSSLGEPSEASNNGYTEENLPEQNHILPEHHEMIVEPLEMCSVEMGNLENIKESEQKKSEPPESKDSPIDNMKCDMNNNEKIEDVNKMSRDEQIEFYRNKLAELEGGKPTEQLAVTLEEVERVFGVRLTDYKFNNCLKEMVIVNELPIEIKDEEVDDDVIIIE